MKGLFKGLVCHLLSNTNREVTYTCEVAFSFSLDHAFAGVLIKGQKSLIGFPFTQCFFPGQELGVKGEYANRVLETSRSL